MRYTILQACIHPETKERLRVGRFAFFAMHQNARPLEKSGHLRKHPETNGETLLRVADVDTLPPVDPTPAKKETPADVLPGPTEPQPVARPASRNTSDRTESVTKRRRTRKVRKPANDSS